MGSIFEDYANEKIAIAVAEKDEVIRKQQEDNKKRQEESIIKFLNLKYPNFNDDSAKEVFNITDKELQRIKEKYRDLLN